MARTPEGPALYSVETITDLPIEVRLSELVREQALRVTREEVPYFIAVVVDETEPEDGLTRIAAALVVERDS